MAIYHFTAKVVSRGKGQSAVAKAAYNARDKLTNEQTGERHDYSHKGGLLFSGIYLPAHAPDQMRDRSTLWSEAEKAERRKDATIAREYEIALPAELTDEQRRYLVQDFVKENFIRKGYAADVNIHAPDKDGDNRNFHAHILVTDRKLTENGFAASKAERQLKSPERKAELEALRESWEKLGNRHLERHGHAPTLDRRSLEAQGIDREATKHLGPYAAALEKQGQQSELGDLNREITESNAARAKLRAIEGELRDVQAELSGEIVKQYEQRKADERAAKDRQPEKSGHAFNIAATGEKALHGAADMMEGLINYTADLMGGPTKKQPLTREEYIKKEVAWRVDRETKKQEADERRAAIQDEPKTPTQKALQVADGLANAVDRFMSYAADFLAGATPPPKITHEEYLQREEARREVARQVAEQLRSREALARMLADRERGRAIDPQEIRNLDYAAKKEIAARGEPALNEMLDQLEREKQRQRSRDRGGGRER